MSPDVGDDGCFENTGDDEFPSAGACGWKTVSSSRSMKRCSSSTSARLRRAGGRRMISSSLSMKRCSSSTLSRRHARFAEAGSSLDSFESSFVCGDPVMTRVQRVTAALHGHHNVCGTHPSQNSYSVHDACGVWHSENSWGDTEVGGQHFCVHGGTKSLSTCTRTGVRRPAVEKLASPQQASLKLHDETWAGLPMNLGPRILREVEIVPGCAVRVACPSCPDYYAEPPGPGIVIRNMLGWSLLEKTERSGVGVFRGALQGENLFSLLDAAGGWERKGSYRTAWAVPSNSSCSCSYAYGHGPSIGPHTGKRCWPLVWRAIAPLMRPWCG